MGINGSYFSAICYSCFSLIGVIKQYSNLKNDEKVNKNSEYRFKVYKTLIYSSSTGETQTLLINSTLDSFPYHRIHILLRRIYQSVEIKIDRSDNLLVNLLKP